MLYLKIQALFTLLNSALSQKPYKKIGMKKIGMEGVVVMYPL